MDVGRVRERRERVGLYSRRVLKASTIRDAGRFLVAAPAYVFNRLQKVYCGIFGHFPRTRPAPSGRRRSIE